MARRGVYAIIYIPVLVLVIGYVYNQIVYQHSAQYAVDRAIASLDSTRPTRSWQLPFFGKSIVIRARKSKAVTTATTPTVTPEAAPAAPPETSPSPVDDMSLDHPPSLTAQQVDAVLNSYGSPAQGTGDTWIAMGDKYHIDPAYGLAFFVQESTAGTACPKWAGCKNGSDLTQTSHNVGNIICTTGYPSCYGHFRDYPDWNAGIEDWFRLIDTEYRQGRGLTTIDQVVPIYAPPFENNTNGYENMIAATVAGWRQTQAAPVITEGAKAEVIPGMTVNPNAQFDTIDCNSWGFQRKADGWPNDCQHSGSDMLAADGTEVHNAFDCIAIQVVGSTTNVGSYADTAHGGENWMCEGTDAQTGERLRWYYGHLEEGTAVPFAPGTFVPAGTVIGRIKTGYGHTHWQLQVGANLTLADPYKYYMEH